MAILKRPSDGGGEPGPANTLTVGSVTSGSAPQVTITGESPNQVLNFVLQPGANNVLAIGTVTGLPAGSTPTVSITGNSPNQVINFGLAAAQNGVTPTLSIGTVTTGPVAAASITGTAPNYVVNFTIPPGASGSTPAFSIGTISTLPAGSSATVSLTGTAPNYIINMGIPSGNAGVTPTLSIGTVSTLAAGSSATASISGTAPNYVVNIGIPVGATGATGVSYNPQSPVTRTVTIGTAYQHTDTTKPFKCVANVRATQTLTVAGLSADRLEVRVGPTAAAVANGGSGGFSLAIWESGITGIALMIGAGIQDGGQMVCDIPAGWYFQINRLSGTAATVVSCFTQSMTA